jgi:hypothetical protein
MSYDLWLFTCLHIRALNLGPTYVTMNQHNQMFQLTTNYTGPVSITCILTANG